VRDIIERNYEGAMTILVGNRDRMEAVVDRLMEKETIERAEFLEIMAGVQPTATDQASVPPAGPSVGPAAPVTEVRLRPAAEAA
jgi:hypothetical protein